MLFRSRLPLLIPAALAAALTLSAQQAPKKAVAARPRRVSFVAPYMPPVSGVPLEADYTIQTVQTPAGGEPETWHSTAQVARDPNGRVRHELHDSVPASFTKEPPLLGVVILDPVARITHSLDPVLRVDDRQWFHPPHSSPFDPASSGGEDLGARTIDGIEVKGVRRAWRLPAHLGDAAPPTRVVDETWYSSELQLIVFEQQTDSSGAVVTINLSHLDRSEPAAELFKVPWGYHLPGPLSRTSGPAGLPVPGVAPASIP